MVWSEAGCDAQPVPVFCRAVFGNSLCLSCGAVDSDSRKAGGYALVQESEVRAQEFARVVSWRVYDNHATVLGVLSNVFERCDDPALPAVEWAADVTFEVYSVFAHNAAKLVLGGAGLSRVFQNV